MAEARLRAGLSFRQLAERCAQAGRPVDHSTLVRIESGQSKPWPEVQKVIAEALGLDPLQPLA